MDNLTGSIIRSSKNDKEKFAAEKFNPLTSLYTAKISDLKKEKINDSNSNEITFVTVEIELERNKDLKLFHILTDDEDIQFPPLHLKPITYTMPVENNE